jgi:hypothetical protein
MKNEVKYVSEESTSHTVRWSSTGVSDENGLSLFSISVGFHPVAEKTNGVVKILFCVLIGL